MLLNWLFQTSVHPWSTFKFSGLQLIAAFQAYVYVGKLLCEPPSCHGGGTQATWWPGDSYSEAEWPPPNITVIHVLLFTKPRNPEQVWICILGGGGRKHDPREIETEKMTHSNEHNHSKQGASSLESCWRGQEEENVEDDDYRRGISSYQWKQALPWKRLRGFTTHGSKMRFAAKRTVNISIEPHEPRKKWPSTTGGRPQGVWNVDSRFVSTSTLWCNTACDKGELPPHVTYS